ncbi:50S ribosomal protein L4 [Candidatus Roizmanbacteria bacterium RIFOXYB2_FULL_41_10]|uniref:Large ribosomal subunit protein uL4 n=1 Tax=Candidatus Roizmanbacteria bacterium RIFOXYA1_FULL_41_12 TaxID=1802082 RepID=A0A1F7K976_9BACT|nr:MAG: 50S ribosomal protein L4 [Candidatus Roizmanbacteria bacterium RIFOXYA1_FULL_41_12]OGK67877.1 MAG: 50S ribosomal protein L4 [Candidatus Roizmanbacteria bacterium RIFOXYB1_FULL_41_27]OGK68237.1 MAG: 50S ribosomal protein L4 [Candidatus Roizmanbacteria bacterium RIFOXYA2_FULL_41_8]OGK69200.1 MAG: 50S ribosomal protein L4 [Candidatus Roizmanbacteria bacterium RIFOXYB2_FULL_41_10]OGK72013.1 MAG: 50S ribosomal protein L4 [Candidatus Roizmanbacteria bacterium RIFOXYC1_FULL_41_16]OGK74664.1 M
MVKADLLLKDIKLPKEIFGVVASDKLLAQYVYVYLNNLKKGRHQTKTRSMVTGSTRKIYRQKGTGRARHGDIKAPIFVGGGIAFGPTGDYRQLKLTKKMRRKALFYALSLKAKDKKLFLVNSALVDKVNKTKQAQDLLGSIKLKGSSILILPHHDKAQTFFQNLYGLTVNEPMALNAYRVLQAKNLIFTEKSVAEFISLFKHE